MSPAVELHPRRHRRRCACGRLAEGNGPAGPQAFTCPGGRGPLRQCAVCTWPEHEERGDTYPRRGGRIAAAWWICDDCANVDKGTDAA